MLSVLADQIFHNKKHSKNAIHARTDQTHVNGYLNRASKVEQWGVIEISELP